MATTYFIDYATGSDSNSGMSKSGPWKTAPGMANQGARTYTHTAGDLFIFKGGVTWPVACFPLSIVNGGVPGTYDYYGIDQSWYTGASWSRPKFDLAATHIGIGSTGTDAAAVFVQHDWVKIQGLEITRLKYLSWETGAYSIALFGDHFLISDCYVHDWAQPEPIASNGGDNNYGGGIGWVGPSSSTWDIRVTNCVFDQAGVTAKCGSSTRNIAEVDHCEMHDTNQGCLGGYKHHHNHIHHFPLPSDPGSHCNAIETFQSSLIYSNLIHDTSGPTTPIIATGDSLIYNNVCYLNNTQVPIGISGFPVGQANSGLRAYNNTIVTNAYCINISSQTGDTNKYKYLDARNNLFITTGSTPVGHSNPAQNLGTPLVLTIDHNTTLTPTQAAALGYTSANHYQPPAGSPTIGAGADLSAVFTDDRLGNLRTLPWDTGAYESGTNPTTGDTIAPAAAMTSPANGATLTGSTTLSATATDAVGVTSVTFYLDSSPIATLTSPTSGSTFSTTLDTTLLANGAHTIRADARDAAGNVGSASVSVTVANGSSGGGSPGPNVLANPGFETGPFDVASTVSGWTVTGRVKDSNEGGSVGGTGHGAQFGYGGNTQGNILEQTFPTVIGKQYTFSFQAGVFGQPTATSQLRAMIIGGTTLLNSVVTPPVSNSFTPSATPFQLYSFTFTANSTSTIVRFTDIGTGNASADVILDNVSITTDAPAAGPAILHVAPPSIDWSYIGVNDSPDDETVTITNQGETDLTGTATVDVGMFSIVGSADYTIAPGDTQDITLRYRPTAKGLHTATVTLTGGGGGSVALRGACYPVAGSLTGFQAEDALILSPFVAAAGKVSQPLETTTPLFGGVLVVGFDIVSADLYTVQAMVACTTDSTNSFFVQDDAEPTDPADIWDVPVTTGTELRTVGARGTGTFNDPEKPVRTFDWGVGRHFIVIRGREQNAAIDSLSIVAVAPPAAPPATPSTPSPANSATSVATTLSAITWTGDGTTYDVKFGTTSPPTQVASGLTSASYTLPAALAYDTDYFWQIVAHGPGGMTSSAIFTFHTIAAPAVIDPPSNPIPTDAATSVSLTPSLRWDASPGTFIVKLGTAATPVTVVGTVTVRQFDVSAPLTPDTVYYWQVNSGPIWSFRTVTVAPPKKVPAILFVRRA